MGGDLENPGLEVVAAELSGVLVCTLLEGFLEKVFGMLALFRVIFVKYPRTIGPYRPKQACKRLRIGR